MDVFFDGAVHIALSVWNISWSRSTTLILDLILARLRPSISSAVAELEAYCISIEEKKCQRSSSVETLLQKVFKVALWNSVAISMNTDAE